MSQNRPFAPLWAAVRPHRRRLVVTYLLFNLENVLLLARPLALGHAVADSLAGRTGGLLLMAAVHLASLAVGTTRRRVDTRAFAAVAADLATAAVQAQRAAGVGASAVLARARLSRELVGFAERELPLAVSAGYAVAGGLAVLVWLDPWLAGLSAAVGLPLVLAGRRLAAAAERLAGRANDEAEREGDVVAAADPPAVAAHYRAVAGWQVRGSDAQAWGFAVAEGCGLLLTLAAVGRGGLTAADPAGFYAAYRYVVLVAGGFDLAAVVGPQLGRLRDIGRRLSGVEPPSGSAGAAG